MVKEKYRYFLIENLDKTSKIPVDARNVVNQVLSHATELYGDRGYATLKRSLINCKASAPPGMFLLRTPAGHAQMVSTTLPFVTHVSGQAVQLQLLRTSSTLRGAYRHAMQTLIQRRFSVQISR